MKNEFNKYHYDGTKFKKITLIPSNNHLDKLPSGVYEFVYNETPSGPDYGFKQVSDKFTIPSNVVNQNNELNRVLNTYSRSDKSMGALFSGVGGTGKTLLCKRIANECIEKLDMPTIFITEKNAAFIHLILECLTTPAVFIFDEFEKIYKESSSSHNPFVGVNIGQNEQNKFLSILDGMELDKHLFLITVNEISKVNYYLKNRPSRIRYHFEFDKIPLPVIKEIVDKYYIPVLDECKDQLVSIFNTLVQTPTYDTLFELIKECNLYPDEEPIDLIQMMNIDLFKFYINQSEYELKYDLELTPEQEEKYKDVLNSYKLFLDFDDSNMDIKYLYNIARKGLNGHFVGHSFVYLEWEGYRFGSGNTYTYLYDQDETKINKYDCFKNLHLNIVANPYCEKSSNGRNGKQYALAIEFAKLLFSKKLELIIKARTKEEFLDNSNQVSQNCLNGIKPSFFGRGMTSAVEAIEN